MYIRLQFFVPCMLDAIENAARTSVTDRNIAPQAKLEHEDTKATAHFHTSDMLPRSFRASIFVQGNVWVP